VIEQVDPCREPPTHPKGPFLTANEEKIDQDGAYQVVGNWKDVGKETRIDGNKENPRQQVIASGSWMQANSKRS
jgi:hypothetical protein